MTTQQMPPSDEYQESPDFWIEHDRLSVEMASNRAAICGTPTCWLANSKGETLLQELASTGHHLMHQHETLPAWLLRKVN